MIVSASRRTDIPAFYSQWLLKRLEEGYVCVRNPMNRNQVSRIRLNRETVDCLVLWTKNPEPIIPLLPRLDAMGFPYYFQFTLTAYGKDLEPGLPEKTHLAAVFRELSRRLGKNRVVWRYDPVICSEDWTISRHLEMFGRLAEELKGAADTCVVSFLDRYRKIEKKLDQLGLRPPDSREREEFLRAAARMAATAGMELETCSEEGNYPSLGVRQGSCISGERIEKITGRRVTAAKDKTQRPSCGCVKSVDIGMYDTCAHGCVYCYASRSRELIGKNRGLARPDSPYLSGEPDGRERITERDMPSVLGKPVR